MKALNKCAHEVITDRLWKGSQSWNRVMILEVRDHLGLHTDPVKLRVRIKRDGYDEQSYGRIERWDGRQWQPLHAIAGGSKELKAIPSYIADATRKHFEAATEELLRVALKVVW